MIDQTTKVRGEGYGSDPEEYKNLLKIIGACVDVIASGHAELSAEELSPKARRALDAQKTALESIQTTIQHELPAYGPKS